MAKTARGVGSGVYGLGTNPKPSTSQPSADDVRAKHKEFLFPCVANYYDEPIVLVQGKGSCVRDAEGREYLDFRIAPSMLVSKAEVDDAAARLDKAFAEV